MLSDLRIPKITSRANKCGLYSCFGIGFARHWELLIKKAVGRHIRLTTASSKR